MIEINCPHCNHLLRIKSKYAGQKGGCKHCGGVFVVPDAYSSGQAQDAAPSGGLPLDSMDDLPALDPAFAQQMADQPVEHVEPSTSLDDLKNAPMVEPEAGAAPLPPPRPARVIGDGPLGCMFWGTAFLVPPAGLVWSFLIPSGHPDKVKGIVVSSLFSVVAILCVVLSAWLASLAQDPSAENDWDEIASFDQEPMPAPIVQARTIPASPPPVRGNAPSTRTGQAFPQQTSQVAQAPATRISFENFVMPSYEGLYLEFPQRLTPASLGRSLSSFGDYDVRYISIGEGTVTGSIGGVADVFQRQLTEQGFKTSTSFGFGTSVGESRTVKCEGAVDEWFSARMSAGAGDGVHVFVALHAGDSGWAFALSEYANPQDDPIPAMPGITFAPPDVVNANLLDNIDDALSAFDIRNLVIREAYVDMHYEEIAKTYQDYFKQEGWETGMAFGFDSSGDYRALLAQRDRWAVEIKIENQGDQKSRVVVVSPLE